MTHLIMADIWTKIQLQATNFSHQESWSHGQIFAGKLYQSLQYLGKSDQEQRPSREIKIRSLTF